MGKGFPQNSKGNQGSRQVSWKGKTFGVVMWPGGQLKGNETEEIYFGSGGGSKSGKEKKGSINIFSQVNE